jgi:hypothetical protein
LFLFLFLATNYFQFPNKLEGFNPEGKATLLEANKEKSGEYL